MSNVKWLIVQVWLSLADNYLHGLCIDWEKTVSLAFNRKSNPDDNKLEQQIAKVDFMLISFYYLFTRANSEFIITH